MTRIHIPLLLLLFFSFLFSSCARQENGGDSDLLDDFNYKNAELPIEERVENLLGHMTFEEKLAQTRCLWMARKHFMLDYENKAKGRFNPDSAEAYLKHGIGQIGPTYLNLKPQVAFHNTVNKWVMENTRLGIPVIFHGEFLHGLKSKQASSFPQAIAMAGTFDPELAEACFSAAAAEGRARGITQGLTPVLDVGRSPRWGRIGETYGEDPYLITEMGKACIRGLQGDLPYEVGKEKVIATVKHFGAHGDPVGGQNMGPANFSYRELRNIYHYPFEWAIKDAGPMSLMPSYNEIDGIISHDNPKLLRDLLREDWGFEGTVVSDYNALERMQFLHHVTKDFKSSGIRGLYAGVDYDFPDGVTFEAAADTIRHDPQALEYLDEAVRRILKHKFQLGLFEHPYFDMDEAERLSKDSSTWKLAKKAALKSICLLENKNKTLPLDPDEYKKIAVIGPMAHRCYQGEYSSEPRRCIGLLDGLKKAYGDRIEFTYSRGCQITYDSPNSERAWQTDTVIFPTPEEDWKEIREAVKVARKNELIVLAIGANEHVDREAWSYTHQGDKNTLAMVGRQVDLLKELKKTGKPIVAVLQNGTPMLIQDVLKESDAVLECWFLGQEGGLAMADVLFGEYNPGAKLPVTFPASDGLLPQYYNHKRTRYRGYVQGDTLPLLPFGYGLSYTTFEIGDPQLSSKAVQMGDTVFVKVSVKNTGSYNGDEVVQLYIRDVYSTVTRPVKELKDFQRVTLKPDEKRIVELKVTPRAMQFFGKAKEWTMEPGTFRVMVGPNSVDLKTAEFTLEE